MLQVLFVSISALFILFVLFGVIGPKWLRIRMRKFNTWAEKEGALLFPLDPYKPLGEALKESLKNPIPPIKGRFIGWIILFLSLFFVIWSLVAK